MGDPTTSGNGNNNLSININRQPPGPFQSYSYGAFINSPGEMGMTGETTGWGLETIGTNFGGLMSYVQMLVMGDSRASKAASINYPMNGKFSGAPLGNAYIYNTGLKCKSNVDGSLQNAVAYINNIPLGNIPFISGFGGAGNIQQLRGVLPGIFENLGGFNPMILFDALDISDGELCQIDIETKPEFSLPITNITPDGKNYQEGKPPVEYSRIYTFASLAENIDPCLFRGKVANNSSSRKNPVSGERCRESFSNINNSNTNTNLNKMNIDIDNNIKLLSKNYKEDWIIQLYYILFCVLIIFMLIKILNKHR